MLPSSLLRTPPLEKKKKQKQFPGLLLSLLVTIIEIQISKKEYPIG